MTLFPFTSVITHLSFIPLNTAGYAYDVSAVLFPGALHFVHPLSFGSLYSHWYFNPSPVATTFDVIFWPFTYVWLTGCSVIFISCLRLYVASSDMTLFPFTSVITHLSFIPLNTAGYAYAVSAVLFPGALHFVHPLSFGSLYSHWYFSPSPVATTFDVIFWPFTYIWLTGCSVIFISRLRLYVVSS